MEETAGGTRAGRLGELAGLFLKLGTTAFGGPAAHLAMMQREVVQRRKWFTEAEFLEMFGAANLIPGPTSTEMTIHIGYRRAGWRGLVVAGACFILPAAVMCGVIAALYVHYEGLRIAQGVLWGVKPVVIGVVAQALWRLARSVVKNVWLGAAAAGAAGVLLAGANELAVLFGTGAVVMAVKAMRGRGALMGISVVDFRPMMGGWGKAGVGPGTAVPGLVAGAGSVAGGAPLLMVFLIFLKIGAVLFGSGYVLLAFLRADFVERYHWLTESQLLDAVAVGQVTPGPVFTTATFIGYVATGSAWGAAVATVAIFLPAFAFVAISAPLLPRLRKSAPALAFLEGLNAASLALMAVVTAWLTVEAVAPAGADGVRRLDRMAVGLAALSMAVLSWKDVNAAWVVLAGAAAGLIRGWVL